MDDFNCTIEIEYNDSSIGFLTVVIASFIEIMSFGSVAINFIILVFTLATPKFLEDPSVIFLTNFIVTNLIVMVVYMPLTLASIATGEWILGEAYIGVCQLIAFVLYWKNFEVAFNLTVISVDRYFFIVKPVFHKNYIKPWLAVGILVGEWVIAAVYLMPFHGLISFEFVDSIDACLISSARSSKIYLAFGILIIFTCLVIVMVMSIVTYCHVRKYLNRVYTESDSGYNLRQARVVGMFSTLIVVTAICYFFLLLKIVASFIMDLPPEADYMDIITTCAITILNPLVQVCFRKELKDKMNCE